MCFAEGARPPLPPVRGGAVDKVSEDVGAAVAWLRSLPGASVKAVFTVGFRLGGALSWRQSAGGPGLAGGIGLYGRPDRARDVVPAMSAPLLLLAAGGHNTTVADLAAFAGKVRAAGAEGELHVYPDAVHSFFDRRFEEYREECDDAWPRMLAFIGAHGAS